MRNDPQELHQERIKNNDMQKERRMEVSNNYHSHQHFAQTRVYTTAAGVPLL